MSGRNSRKALTLIELILVMALLGIVMAVSAPALSRFMRGRSLDEEGRRIVAMTRYARAEAVSLGIPMEVWFDIEDATGGVRPVEGFRDEAIREYTMKLSSGLAFEPNPEESASTAIVLITFRPDGTIALESAAAIRLKDEDGTLQIARADSAISYKVVQP